MDDASWRSLYMNEPIEREATLFSADELQYFSQLPDREPDNIIAVCDTKEQGADYCAMPVLYQYGDMFYINSFVCDNGKVESIQPKVAQRLVDEKVKMCQIESNRGGTLFAQTVKDKVKELGVPVRAVPNVAYDAYFPHENGVHGMWIRPEDIPTYDEFVDVFEFEDADLAKERALYRIYHDDGNWPGNLNLIFTNFNYPVENKYLLTTDTLAKRRTVCGQRCQYGRACGLCEMCLDFGNPNHFTDAIESSDSTL